MGVINIGPAFTFVGPFAESPLPQDGQAIQDAFFYGADETVANGAKVISEPTVNEVLTQQITTFLDQNADGIKAETDAELFVYQIRVFVSTSDIMLREAYEKCTPDDMDVCIFLEDNEGDFLSSASSYVKIGKEILEDMRKRLIIADMEAGELNLNGLNVRIDQPELEFSSSEIKELITHGEIKNPNIATMAMFLQMATYVNTIGANGFEFLGNGLMEGTKSIREYLIFKSEDWDPDAKTEDDKKKEPFVPYLFSGLSATIDDASAISSQIIDQAKRLITSELNRKRAGFKARFNQLSKLGLDPLFDVLYETIDKGVSILLDGVESVLSTLAYLGKRWLNAVNAFFCGLWNGLVEAVLGIVDLIGLVLLGLAKIGQASENAKDLIAQALELLDEGIQAFQQADILGMLSTAVNKVKEHALNLNLFGFSNLFSIEKMSYFMGAFVGFLIEMIVDIYFSGGAKAVRDVVNKSFSFLDKQVLEKIRKLFTLKLGDVATFSAEYVLKIVGKLILLLRKGKDGIAKLIDDIVDVLKAGAKIPQALWQEIVKATGFTMDQLRKFQKMGLDIVDFKDGVCIACFLSNKIK